MAAPQVRTMHPQVGLPQPRKYPTARDMLENPAIMQEVRRQKAAMDKELKSRSERRYGKDKK